MIITAQTSGQPSKNDLELRTRRVRPTRYQDRDLRTHIGNLIGHADADRVLGSYLWVAEGIAAREALDYMHDWLRWAEETLAECQAQLESPRPCNLDWDWVYTQREVDALFACLCDALQELVARMRELSGKADAEFEALRAAFGSDVSRFFGGGREAVSPLETIFGLWTALVEAADSISEQVTRTLERARELQKANDRRRAFDESGQGVSATDLRRLDGHEFEKLTSRLLARDGLAIEREGGGSGDQGADVIAITQDGRRLVFQCKVRHRGPIAPQIFHAVNGTARQIHNADIPVVATNSTFSPQAAAFAEHQDIRLIDGHSLTCWASWGDSVYDVLGIPTPDTAVPRAAAA